MSNLQEAHPLDNSALIHLAVHSKRHSNVFRLEVHLRSAVRPARLQQAADAAAARLPMLAACIRKQRNQFVVLPCPERLNIRFDRQALAYLSAKELQDCAMRVLYGHRHIAVEFFHSLTDGNGGLQFLKTLLAEYFGLPAEPVSCRDAWEDSYRKYAAGKPTSLPGGASYLLPPAPPESGPFHRTTLTFPVEAVQARAKAEHTTLTAFFTALFAQAAMELQKKEAFPEKPLLPVQIMVPMDLRRRFASSSLRNFSLYALPCLTPESADLPFPDIVESISAQIRAQSSCSLLRTAMATNVELERQTAALPLWLKRTALRVGFELCGGRSSCLTVSNLGPVAFPEPIRQEIFQLDFLLTPRAHSPYNCGIVSTGDTLSLTITRRGPEKGFEALFTALLAAQGITPCFAGTQKTAPASSDAEAV